MQLLRKLAFPISLVYALVVIIRNYLYDVGFFKSNSFDTKTICVGNLSVGGTGKTPMIEYLIHLLSENKKVSVLSRGYKRKSIGFVLASSNTTVEELGDEPFQIHSKFTNIKVAVDVDRSNGIKELERIVQPDIILMDDAFQHRKVKPDFSILLTTFDNPYFSDWYLPTGDLRDSIKEAKRANVIVVTKCPDGLPEGDKKAMAKQLKVREGQQVLFSSIAYDTVIKGKCSMALNELLNKKFTLITGIAKPEPLVVYLKNSGLDFKHLEFNDHHFFTDVQIDTFNAKELILTTEKDYVRLKGKVENLYYIPIKTHFLNEGENVMKSKLKEFMR